MSNEQKTFAIGDKVTVVAGCHIGRTGEVVLLAPYALYPITVMLDDETPKIDRIFYKVELGFAKQICDPVA